MNRIHLDLKFSLLAVLRARCPSCHHGEIYPGVFSMAKRCPECGYDFYPEPGFYLGAIALGFLVSAILIIPPVIILKLWGVEASLLVIFPIIEFLVVAPLLMTYAKVLWLHLEYQTTRRLDRF